MDIARFFRENPYIPQIIQLGITIAIALVILFFVLRLERRIFRRIAAAKPKVNFRQIENIVRFLIILFTVECIMLSSPLTENIGKSIFQSTAVITAITGFAAQQVIADLISGLIISMTKPFRIGDRIELEDGTAGVVKEISLRHVRLTTIDTMQKIIPNSTINHMAVVNTSYETDIRSIHFRFSVGYNTDMKQAMEVISKAIEDSPYSIPEREWPDGTKTYGPVYFLQIGDSSLTLGTTVYFKPLQPSEFVKNDINMRVRDALNEAGIEMPYNYVNVIMPDEENH